MYLKDELHTTTKRSFSMECIGLLIVVCLLLSCFKISCFNRNNIYIDT